jgi:hypothetical protein
MRAEEKYWYCVSKHGVIDGWKLTRVDNGLSVKGYEPMLLITMEPNKTMKDLTSNKIRKKNIEPNETAAVVTKLE